MWHIYTSYVFNNFKKILLVLDCAVGRASHTVATLGLAKPMTGPPCVARLHRVGNESTFCLVW